MPILSSRAFLENVKDPIYDLLSLIEPGIFLDIGASDGHMSALMLEKSPQSHVIAVEPFPANVQHMRDRLGSDSRVTIVPQAIYPYATEVRFAVASTVTDASGERRPGYSSLGRVVEKDDAAAEINIVVPATTVDKLLNDKCARFMKVDVQGGEIGVIRSAKAALEEQRIDIIFLEFAGHEPAP
jgi:FkbM family methyltransferase